MIWYVVPTCNRPMQIARTLSCLGGLAEHEARVVVVDNASTPAVDARARLANGMPCDVIRLGINRSAAARNDAVHFATAQRRPDPGDWIVMLDDDSAPMDVAHVRLLDGMSPDVAAVGAEVLLPGPPSRTHCMRHDAGGLPEVFTGCGAAIRLDAFIASGGYDASFDYYAEEYDLCAKLIAMGMRIVHDCRFRVLHDKSPAGRDIARILGNLGRNNAWIMARYAPDCERESRVRAQIVRYRAIAQKEGVVEAYDAALRDIDASLAVQPRRTLTDVQWERFIGMHAARAGLARVVEHRRVRTAAIACPGKGVDDIVAVLQSLHVRVVEDAREADIRVVGSLSPGVVLDAVADDPSLVAAWMPNGDS